MMNRTLRWTLTIVLLGFCSTAILAAPTRVLFVGGDWKSQISGDPVDPKNPPLRGHFVRRQTQGAAAGELTFTLWTNYEFLQYADETSLRRFDVIVVGDLPGPSMTARVAKAVETFVDGGGGFLYCDNHKGFSFISREMSFDSVLPVHVDAFRPMGSLGPDDAPSQLILQGKPIQLRVKQADHPILKGLNLDEAAPLKAAHSGRLKQGATVLAESSDGHPLWICWDKGRGRVLYTGGFFANDELSAEFCKWPRIGQLYVQMLRWLAAGSQYPRADLSPAVATGEIKIDLSVSGPTLSAKHFSIHGQEDVARGSDAEKQLYAALNLDGGYARFDQIAIAKFTNKNGYQYPAAEPDLSLDNIHWTDYDTAKLTKRLADIAAIKAEPIGMFWMPWNRGGYMPDPKVWTKYYFGALLTANGRPGTDTYQLNVKYFEPGNEPNLDKTIRQYIDFINYAGDAIHRTFPGVQVGCLGNYDLPYTFPVIDAVGKNVDWISRHPYGQTGEAVFLINDQILRHARDRGMNHLRTIITEWDFWIYGEPAFDYIMQRWKPLADHADDCLGSLHYRWNEYHEGGYVFGVRGVFAPDANYGKLPPEGPHPGRDKPITYRYNAFWLIRNCRGAQYPASIDAPAFASDRSPRLYAIASHEGPRFNIVTYYGYPYGDPAAGKRYDRVKLHLRTAIPASVVGRTLTITRADARTISTSPATVIDGSEIDLELEIPALSGVSITVE